MKLLYDGKKGSSNAGLGNMQQSLRCGHGKQVEEGEKRQGDWHRCGKD